MKGVCACGLSRLPAVDVFLDCFANPNSCPGSSLATLFDLRPEVFDVDMAISKDPHKAGKRLCSPFRESARVQRWETDDVWGICLVSLKHSLA